jgi:pantothenate kinase-related protein Tda10
MVNLFAEDSMNCISISLDDFYLTGEEQVRLAETHANNPLLKYRGNGEIF